MDEERFASARENPRNIGFANCNNSNKSMPNDIAVQKPPSTTILDRFRIMLKKREDELRVSGDLLRRPEEIVRLYELVLNELSFNSKPIITDLTIIAGEQREHGEGIADVICARIIEVPVEIKLPSLYLLDSIVKNIGREYVRYFSSRLPEVFCEAYKQVHPSMHPAMHHLFGTWSAVFPTSVLRKIEAELQFSPSVNHQSSGLTSLRASESPRPTHGIHVNPKYLEARHQFEISTADVNIQHGKGTSSPSNVSGQNLAIGYDGSGYDNTEVISSLVGGQRLSSSGRSGRTSFALGAEKLPSTSAASRLARSSSPFRIGHPRTLSTSIEEFAVDSSPRRITERSSVSHSGLENGTGRVTGRDEDMSDWQRNHWSDDTEQRFETSAYYSYSNGVEHQSPRALIDAYGNDRGKRILNNKHLKVEHLDINGIDSKVASKTWQNTEEEEFDWEDMSPTLLSSDPPRGSFRTRPGLGARSAAPLEADFRRSSWSTPAQLSVVDDSSVALEDAVPTIGSGRGSTSKIAGFHNGTTQMLGSHYPQEAWNFPGNLPYSSQHQLNTKGSGRNFQMPFPGGIASSAGEQKPLIDSFPDASGQVHGSLTMGSRIGSSGLDLLNPGARPAAVPASKRAWPPVNLEKSHPPPLLNNLPPQKQLRNQFDLMNSNNAFMNQSINKTFFPEQHLDNIENKVMSSGQLPQFPSDQAGPIPLNMKNPLQVIPLQPHFRVSQEVKQNLGQAAGVSMPSSLMVPPVNHGYTTQGHGSAVNAFLLNPIPAVHPSMPILNIPKSSMHLQGPLPPLPPGPPPASSQMIQPILQNPGLIVPNPPAGNAFSGLFNSLVAQGLISLTKEAPVQDSVGLEFDLELLKVRHESVVTALYADLPRQCKTCGLRFRSQDEHSSHMDWHVTKNRMSKNRKQKPSRKWFPSIDLWLSGAEALGTDAIPVFLPTENVEEKKDDEELAVPADEEQNVCALCGERFDDFYSDETEEWMYKGAVYMNAPDGSMTGMDRSQLGPIVHAKCRSESSAVSPEGFGRDEGGYTEEGSQRKRMRS
ncbi:polyadenylation and cleavage factor homolog 4 [Cornus florida]|uniref:polyadenylation and cleavage factor homolog 4 n=1 Tax=Cornus florida TaxID=4283 RepID=UPI0028979524|nr:polyadenylation and cleavage factor homolog 4 [Cornus florida]